MSQAVSPFHLKRILVPTDFSAPSARALAYGAAFARQFRAELIALHVHDQVVSSPAHSSAVETLQLLESIHRSLRDEMEKFAEPLLVSGGETLPCRFLVVDGAAADGIVQTAKEEQADLLVIATHGRTGLKHILLGSVAEKVVRLAPCPVLVVREHEQEFIDLPGKLAGDDPAE